MAAEYARSTRSPGRNGTADRQSAPRVRGHRRNRDRVRHTPTRPRSNFHVVPWSGRYPAHRRPNRRLLCPASRSLRTGVQDGGAAPGSPGSSSRRLFRAIRSSVSFSLCSASSRRSVARSMKLFLVRVVRVLLLVIREVHLFTHAGFLPGERGTNAQLRTHPGIVAWGGGTPV